MLLEKKLLYPLLPTVLLQCIHERQQRTDVVSGGSSDVDDDDDGVDALFERKKRN